MPDAFEELQAEFEAQVRDDIAAIAFRVNELLEPLVRRKTGRLRASVMGNWDTGRQGRRFKPPAGLDPHPIPRGDDIRQAIKVHQIGNGLSTRSELDYSFWIDQDKTFEEVAAIIDGESIG